MKNTFIMRFNNKKNGVWLVSAIVVMLLTLSVVSGMDFLLKGEITADYLITGLVASVLAASIVGGLTIYFLQLLTRSHHDNDNLNAIIKAFPIPIALNNDSHQILMLNPEFTRMFGYTLEDTPTLEDWWVKAYPDSDYRQWVADTWSAHLQDMNSSGTAFEPFEVEIFCKNGKTKSVMTTATPLGNPSEGVHLVVLYDISERKEIENELWLTKSIIDKSKTAFYRISPQGVVQFVNDYACQSLGYTREELIGMRPWDFDPDFPAEALPDVWERLKNKEIVHIESRHRRKDGSTFDVEVTCHYNSFNGEEFSFTLVKDITERKRIETALRQKEGYQRALIDNFPFEVWLKDTESRFLAVNQVFASTFGENSSEQLVGKNDFDIAPSGLAEAYRADDRAVMAARQKKVIEEEIGDEGEWVETFKAPVIDYTGELLGTVGFARDISERKRIELELRIAATAFESQEGMFITNANNIIIRVNSAFTRITGYTAEDAVGMTPRLLSSGYHQADFYAEMWNSINNNCTWAGEIWNKRKNGDVILEYITITAVTDNQRLVTNYVATLTDVSNYKKNELRRLADEISLRDILVLEVHHRIKNNLQGVTGVLRNFVTKYPEFGVQINEAIGQVESIAIIHGLQGRVALSKVRVCELTSEIAANNGVLWQVPIVVDIPNDWIPCRIAETEAVPLALVLNELIANAIKHGDHAKGVNITLRHEPLPHMIQVTISNSGRLPPGFDFPKHTLARTGLQLVASLLPKKAVKLSFEQCGDIVSARLELTTPIITLEQKKWKSYDGA